MKTTVLFLSSLVGSATSFSPVSRAQVGSSLRSTAEVAEEETEAAPATPAPETLGFCRGYVGGEGPEPMPFTLSANSENWDPLNFCERAPEWIPWFREAELKHCRIAMLASLGIVVPEFVRIPGEQFSFENVPYVIEAHDKLPDSMSQIFLWISLCEACTFGAVNNMNSFDRAPGDYSFDPLGIYPTTPENQREMQLAELKNGRLAMIAIGGMVAGSLITGERFPYL